MRGTPDQLDREGHGRGIIPAYAGNTARTRRSSIRPRDHPRICGEHSHSPSAMSVPGESSPHMRGTPSHHAGLGYGGGIIPAYAGNTNRIRGPEHDWWDHPRICGEHLLPCVTLTEEQGIIPAYAGNTNCQSPSNSPIRDHPRICGEHRIVGSVQYVREGSSPHMRGTLEHGEPVVQVHGIIPAYAGNTSSSAATRTSTGDHPRICGEHVIPLCRRLCQLGSSPHMRGTLLACGGRHRRNGIIPAYAGNTRWM